MRFTRFPRVEQPTQPSARRVAAAKRAVQAEKDRYPLFPELVRYATAESHLDAMQEHRITWWQQHRNHVAASWREARASLRSLPPGPHTVILRYWQTCSLPGHPVYLLGMLHDHRARKRCFWHALAELRRLKLNFRRASPKPLETFMVEIAISCDMSQTFGSRMNSDPKQKRERVQQLAQNSKVKTDKVFGADLRKSKIHPAVKKLTDWRKLNRLSQRKAVAVLAKYYFHATFASLRSWEEGRRSPNSHTAAILERFLLDHPSVEHPKK
jgi:hypothetical protein